MRRALDGLYRLSGAVAATFLFLIAATIVAQIAGRFFGVAIDSTETGGFSLAGATFFGLAYTLKTGGHIRVELVVGRFGASAQRAAQFLVCLMATVGSGYLAWKTLGLVHDSWRFGDLSPGLMAIPFWIPQSFMLCGILILTIAFLDELVLIALGRTPGFATAHDPALADPAQE